MGLKIFDRLQARFDEYRRKRRYRQSSTDETMPDVGAFQRAASHDDLTLPPPPPMMNIMHGSVPRPSSAGVGFEDYCRPCPGSSSSSRGFAGGRSAQQPQDTSAASMKAKRASRWTLGKTSTVESASGSSSSDDSSGRGNRLAVPSAASDVKKPRRQTMIQRMSTMYENPEWKTAGRGTMTQEQMQDWRLHAYIQ